MHARRTELQQQLGRLTIAQQKIGNIHEAVCTETAVQKDLLSIPASSETASDSSETTSSRINSVTPTTTFQDKGTCPNQAVCEEPYNDNLPDLDLDLQQSTDRVTEDWCSLSSSSSLDSFHSEVPPDVEASDASSTQTAQQEKSFPLLVKPTREAQSPAAKV